MHERQQATRHKQQAIIALPSPAWLAPYYCTALFNIVIMVTSKAPKVNDPIWYRVNLCIPVV